MKSYLAVLCVFVVCMFVGSASGCPVATVSAFGAPVVVQSQCGVAVQSAPVAVQSYAIPTVAVLQQPVVVQQVVKHGHVRQQRVFQRSVVRTRTVVR